VFKLFASVTTLMFATVLLSHAQEPGIVNFSEGQVAVNGQTLTAGTSGMAIVNAGQTLETEQGRAELLLTPGVYVRIGENSAIKMDTRSATAVKVELIRGEAVVEVDQVDKTRRLDMIDQGADAHLDRSGIFQFDTKEPAIATYLGKIRVEDDRRGIQLNKGQRLLLNGNTLKPEKFNGAETGPLYAWSQRRADYAAQVSEWTGEALLALDGRAKYPDGWYWNPWYKSWAFLPVKGYVRTPFNYGILAPQEPHDATPTFGDFRN
jgi:FecR protein